MNRRSKRRLIVLAVVGGLVVLVGVGGTLVRQANRRDMAERALEKGLAAYEAKDYATTRRELSLHLQYNRQNAQAWVALGDAQRNLPAPNARHLIEARGYLEMALSLDPSNTQARRILLDVHQQLGNWKELAQVAGALLEVDPDDQTAATLRIEALLLMGNENAAIEASKQLVAMRQGDIEAHIEAVRVLQRSGRSAREQREYIEREVEPQHRGTTTFAVLRAGVEYDAGQPQRATELLLQAAQQGPTDGKGARMLLDSLEQVASGTNNPEIFERSQGWLSEWIENPDLSDELYELAAGRAWRQGLPQRAVDLSLRAADRQAKNPGVFAWGLLGAVEMGLDDEPAGQLLQEAFESTSDDGNAGLIQRWREVIEAHGSSVRGQPALDAPLMPIEAGLANLRGVDAVALYIDALNAVTRDDLATAIDRLALLSRQPGWRRARLVLASVLLSQGRAPETLALIRQDIGLVDLPGGAELLADAWASTLEATPGSTQADTGALDNALAENPENPVLLAASGRAAVVTGDLQRARKLAERLSRAEAAAAAVSAVRFSRALRPADPELADAILLRLAETASTPRQVAPVALELASLGDASSARDLVELHATVGRLDMEWAQVRLDVADAIGDAQALRTIDEITKANANDARVLLRALGGEAVWTDAQLASTLIGRLREAQGENGIEWRLFEARRLLDSDDSAATANAAAALLTSVIANDRGRRNTRAMLIAADAFSRAGPVESEMRALEYAADGDNPAAALPRLIDRLQQLGRTTAAQDRLRQFVALGAVPPEYRQARIELLRRQGMADLAAQDIAALASSGQPEAVLRAALLRRPPGTEQPLSQAEQSALEATLSPSGTVLAARVLARLGRLDEGVDRLATLPAQSEAGNRAMIVAGLLSEHGRIDRAIAMLTEEAQASDRAEAWMEAARLLVAARRIDEAMDLLDRAVAAMPGDSSLAGFRSALSNEGQTSELRRMALFAASAASADDASEAVVELGALSKRFVDGNLDAAGLARELEALSQRRATFYPVRPLLMATYNELGQPERAASTALNAVNAMPADPRPTRDAAEILLALNRLDEAVGMAGTWASRATNADDRATAEMLRGVAEFRRGNTARALSALEPHRQRIVAEPDRMFQPLEALAHALVLEGRMGEAYDILMPLAQNNLEWARLMASIPADAPVSDENTNQATRWLESLVPILADDAAGYVAIASSWLTLMSRTGDKAMAQRVVDLAIQVRDSSMDGWQLQALLASAYEAQGKPAEAIGAYERSMELAGEPVSALLNNAAYLLTKDLGNHAKAVAMARRAVERSSNDGSPRANRATYHHTLGSALLGSGDAQAALQAFDQGLALADSTSLRLGRIEALLALGRRTEASEAFRRLSPNDTWSDSNQERYRTIESVIGPR